MTGVTERLNAKFAETARWQRRKRREEIVLDVLCLALAMALLLLPAYVFLPRDWLRWLVPVIFAAALLPFFVYRESRAGAAGPRTAASLDRSLNLAERAVTAWELRALPEPSAAAKLVLQQADAKLGAIDPRALFPRRPRWSRVLAPALALLWLAALYLELDRWNDPALAPRPPTLAQKTKEFSRQFQEKAKNEGLARSRKLGEELEQIARQGVERKALDDQFRRELAAMTQKFADSARSAGHSDAAAQTRERLKDLQAELEAARDFAELPELAKGAAESERGWSERLARLPQLKRELEKLGGTGTRSDIRGFLDKLEQQVASELDRRALLDAHEHLKRLMQQGAPSAPNQEYAQSSATGDEDEADGAAKEKSRGNLPGKEPGQNSDESASLPEFRGDAPTRVKGALGEGESSAAMLKAKPGAGKSSVTQTEVIESYRRQAEQELNSERVPKELKDTIKNYFLSLGEGKP